MTSHSQSNLIMEGGESSINTSKVPLSNTPSLAIKDKGDQLSREDLEQLSTKVSKLTQEHSRTGEGDKKDEKPGELSVL